MREIILNILKNGEMTFRKGCAGEKKRQCSLKETEFMFETISF
jgi:hypothetical protein